MSVSLKKGQEFYYVTRWDDLGTMSVRRLTCEACGKSIIRATESGSDNFIKHVIYQNLVNTPAGQIPSWAFILPVDCDIEAEAMSIAVKYVDDVKKFNPSKEYKASVIYR